MFYIYKLIFYQLQKNNKIPESEKIFSKFLLPVHQKFSNHITFFKQFPCLTIEAKIKIYTLKVMKNLENAKILCKYESQNERKGEKFSDEIDLQTIDLDYDTIHSEILENIIFDENDSGISDFESHDEDEKEQEKKIFEINKIKTIVHKSVKSLFIEDQDNDKFKPLIIQEKYLKEVEKSNDNKGNELITNNEIKTNENTDDFTEDIKEKNINENNSTENIKEIKNYKKYDIFSDPFSNYNNFTKKYKVKTIPKKRFRDIHPFLKTFNPKFLKKENIDKKIFRRFRKFIKLLYKENKNSPIFSKNELFWKKFYFKNLLPPVKIVLNNDQLIEHKSFNTQYLLWLFNQEGTTELFKLFIKSESEKVINEFVTEYNLYKIKEPDIVEKLKEYINYIPEIYDSKNKKVIYEESKEVCETGIFSEKKEDENTYLESIETEKENSNPFNLNFDFIEKKNFKEFPYDNNNFNYLGGNNFNIGYFKENEEIFNKNEKFDGLFYRQLSDNFCK